MSFVFVKHGSNGLLHSSLWNAVSPLPTQHCQCLSALSLFFPTCWPFPCYVLASFALPPLPPINSSLFSSSSSSSNKIPSLCQVTEAPACRSVVGAALIYWLCEKSSWGDDGQLNLIFERRAFTSSKSIPGACSSSFSLFFCPALKIT